MMTHPLTFVDASTKLDVSTAVDTNERMEP